MRFKNLIFHRIIALKFTLEIFSAKKCFETRSFTLFDVDPIKKGSRKLVQSSLAKRLRISLDTCSTTTCFNPIYYTKNTKIKHLLPHRKHHVKKKRTSSHEKYVELKTTLFSEKWGRARISVDPRCLSSSNKT